MVVRGYILDLIVDVTEQDDLKQKRYLIGEYCRNILLQSRLNCFLNPDCCGPPNEPSLFKCFTRKVLGSGSTGEVSQWMCSQNIPYSEKQTASAENGFFQIYASIQHGENVAVKCHAHTTSCIGSFSGGTAPTNYPTKFATGIKERIMGARLASASGIGKEHVSLLLASWFDRHGLWLVFRLVSCASGLDEILIADSSAQDALCSQSLEWTAALFEQFALALRFISSQRVVQRDGGLANWMLSGLESNKPKVTLIDFGLALSIDEPLTAPDYSHHLMQHMFDYEACTDSVAASNENEVFESTLSDDHDIERLSPIDWCYSPGASGPKFPPPPELRVVRESLTTDTADVLKSRGCTLPYCPGYDVWILGWTFIQIILGERWEDWKKERLEDPLVQLVRSKFFEKSFQVEVPWELGLEPPAWRLAVLASGKEHFHQNFLDEFIALVSHRIFSRGLEVASPIQAEFVRPESKLRAVILRMIDYSPARRAEYLQSGSLLRDLRELTHSADSIVVGA